MCMYKMIKATREAKFLTRTAPTVNSAGTPVQVLPADPNRVRAGVSLVSAASPAAGTATTVGIVQGGTYVPLAALTTYAPNAVLRMEDYGLAVTQAIWTQSIDGGVNVVPWEMITIRELD